MSPRHLIAYLQERFPSQWFTQNPIGTSTLENRRESRALFVRGGDDYFATEFVGNTVFSTVLDQCLTALGCSACFDGTWLIINPRMNHPRVSTRLVFGRSILFVDDNDRTIRKTANPCPRSG